MVATLERVLSVKYDEVLRACKAKDFLNTGLISRYIFFAIIGAKKKSSVSFVLFCFSPSFVSTILRQILITLVRNELRRVLEENICRMTDLAFSKLCHYVGAIKQGEFNYTLFLHKFFEPVTETGLHTICKCVCVCVCVCLLKKTGLKKCVCVCMGVFVSVCLHADFLLKYMFLSSRCGIPFATQNDGNQTEEAAAQKVHS